MNFAKLIFVFLFCSLLKAEEIPFTVSGTAPALPPSTNGAPQTPTSLDDPEQQGSLISQLKYQAVTEWLQGYLGNRFPQYEKMVANDFGEKYVLDYKVSRTGANREVLQLSGHLDGNSLKRWVRVLDTKKGGTSVKPILILSSTLTQFPMTAYQTGDRARDNVFGQTVTAFLNHEFQKVNAHPTPVEGNFPLRNPARSEGEIRSLRDFGSQSGANCAVWVNLLPCPSCTGGARADMYLYSLNAPRLVFVESEDLNLRSSEFQSQERVKAALQTLFNAFHTSFDSVVAEGKLLNAEYRIILEGVGDVRTFKNFESELGRTDFASQSVLRKAEARTAEFSILSALTAEEITQRIQSIEMAGKKLSAQRIDSHSILVRYTK